LKMMKAGLLAVGLFAYATPAQAQMTWTNKGFAAVDFGIQAGSHTFDTSTEFPLYDETATLKTSQKGKSGPMVDFRAGYKVWSNLLIGAGYSWTSGKSDVAINASIPHPAEFDKPRAVSLTAADASHTEGALNVSAIWMVPVTDKIDVGIMGGPTVFFVKKDVVTELVVTEPGPAATGTITEASETGVGYHIGLDVQYAINQRLGVGGLARYSAGKVDVTGGEVTVGGFQVGGGIRIRF
jgi:opacity protein-like surface antigen